MAIGSQGPPDVASSIMSGQASPVAHLQGKNGLKIPLIYYIGPQIDTLLRILCTVLQDKQGYELKNWVKGLSDEA